MSRSRAGVCLAATVVAGLASRRWPLPGILAEHTGDALYATAVYFALAVLRPRARPVSLGAVAMVVSAAVECAQLLQWPWLVRLRATRVGALVLGQGFQVADLVAMACGVALALAVHVGLASRRPAGPADRRPGR